MKKGMIASNIFGLFIIMFVLIYGIFILAYYFHFGELISTGISKQYELVHVGNLISDIKELREKPSLFYSLMYSSKELGEHGGISKDTIDANPSLITENEILYWTTVEGSSVKKMIPFTYYEDVNKIINSDEETIDLSVEGNEKPKEVAVQIFFLKNGWIKLNGVIKTKDGLYTIKLKENEDKLKIEGSKDGVAVLRLVAASIYENNIVLSPSDLLKKNVNEFKDVFGSTTQGEIYIKIENLSSAFLNANEDEVGGLVWSPGGVFVHEGFADTAKKLKEEELKCCCDARGAIESCLAKKACDSYDTEIYNLDNIKEKCLGSAALLKSQESALIGSKAVSSGLVEENAKIRYWKLYDNALDFSNKMGNEYRTLLVNKLDELENDHKEDSDSCGSCPGRPSGPTKEQVRQKTLEGIKQIESELNEKWKNEGIVWELSITKNDVIINAVREEYSCEDVCC